MEYQNNYQYTETPQNENRGGAIPEEYKPISSWGYIGYNILFSIPLVGLILLIVFSFSKENINRRNYARSFFCTMLVSIIIVVPIIILSGFVMFSGTSSTVSEASFAMFVNNIDMFDNSVLMSSLELKQEYAIQGEVRTNAQIYYELATGEAADKDEMVPDGETFYYDFLEYDEQCYEITDFSYFEGYGDDMNLYGSENDRERYYITSEGNVFTLPGFEREDGGETRYYVNVNDYYTE